MKLSIGARILGFLDRRPWIVYAAILVMTGLFIWAFGKAISAGTFSCTDQDLLDTDLTGTPVRASLTAGVFFLCAFAWFCTVVWIRGLIKRGAAPG